METGWVRMAWLFREQADGCGRLGSLLYAELLAHAGNDIDHDGVLVDVLVGYEEDSGLLALVLRFVGVVHWIVLSGWAFGFAAFYFSVGGGAARDAAWPHFR